MVQRQVSPRTTETKQIFKLTVNICKQRIFKLIDLAQEIIGVKVAPKTWHKLLGEASTKEAVADDTANNNTSITSRVSQTTLSDFSKNLEEPSPTEKEEAIDDQIRSMDSHAIQCEKEYWSDLRADTGTLCFPDKIVMEQHSLTPSQPWCKVPGVNQRIGRQTQRIRDEAGECHRHTPVRDFDHRSQTYWLKARVNPQAKGKANTWTLLKRISLLKQPHQCRPLKVVTPTRA